MVLRVLALVAVAASLTGVTALAQSANPDDFTPEGYRWCGWKNLSTGSWVMTDPEDGAFLRAFARGMSCRDARRAVTRTRYTQLPPYRPVRQGYRCQTLASDYEYSDVRCRRTGSSVAYRWQTGA
jgi:hypothetical protein